MAIESVPNASRAKQELDRDNRLSELVVKSAGIADLIGHVDTSGLSDDSLSDAAWALHDMLSEVRTMIGRD